MRSVGLLCLLAIFPTAALAQVPNSCDLPRDIDKYQLLRRLSLDLRGQVPTYAEYEALEAQQSIPVTTIGSYLASEGFRQTMRRYHEEALWPNVSNIAISNVNAILSLRTPTEPALSISSLGRRTLFRGDALVNTVTHGEQCGDYEQTNFLDGGTFAPDPAFIYSETTTFADGGSRTVYQEGWRWVTPYWDPTTPVRVCAYDAQETLSTSIGPATVGCDSYLTNGRKECGCGPNLEYCYFGTVSRVVLASLREQLNRSVDDVAVNGQPYTDLLLGTKAYVNGPINQWRKTLSNNLSLSRIYAVADSQEQLALKAFTDTSFSQVNRGKLPNGTEFHAGVTSLPAYLLKFQTGRARANRFRMDFMCESFVPPATLTAEAGCKDNTTELTQRCYCQSCHKTLEPLAAYWGQFTEAGTTMMTDLAIFPRQRASCVGSGNAFCQRFYVTVPGSDRAGALIPYQYAEKTSVDPYRKAAGDNIELGPRALAQQIINDGTFARCTAKRVFRYFVKRDMHIAGAESEEAELLEQLSSGFEGSGYQLPWLVEQVVSLPQYRRIR